MNKHWISPIGAAAAILSVIALALPVLQWAIIPTDTASQWLYGAAALALGLCKLAFFPKSAELYKDAQYFGSLILAVFAGILLYISIESSAQFLAQHTQSKYTQAQAGAQAVEELNAEISGLQALIAKDTQSKYHNIRARITDHQARIDKLKADRKSLEDTAITATTFFGGLLTSFIKAEYLIAICIHLGGILAILCVTAWAPKPKQEADSFINELETHVDEFADTPCQGKPLAQELLMNAGFKPKVIKGKKQKSETQEAMNRHD